MMQCIPLGLYVNKSEHRFLLDGESRITQTPPNTACTPATYAGAKRAGRLVVPAKKASPWPGVFFRFASWFSHQPVTLTISPLLEGKRL
jgi:hypothetical protein